MKTDREISNAMISIAKLFGGCNFYDLSPRDRNIVMILSDCDIIVFVGINGYIRVVE